MQQHGKVSRKEGGTLYGAKITGGDYGGTVCVIGRSLLRNTQHILEVSFLLQKGRIILFNFLKHLEHQFFLLVYIYKSK